MATLTIPTQQGVPFYSQVVNLEGTSYVFTFTYNQRQATWRLTIGAPNPSGPPTPLATVKLVSNWPLLRRLTNAAQLPPGELIAVCNPAGDLSPPGLNDMGVTGFRVQLLYFPWADLLDGEPETLPNQVIPITCSDTTPGDVYTVTIGGTPYTYVVPGGATGPSIAAAIAAMLNTLGTVTATVVKDSSGDPTNVLNVNVLAGTLVTCTTS